MPANAQFNGQPLEQTSALQISTLLNATISSIGWAWCSAASPLVGILLAILLGWLVARYRRSCR